MPKKKEGKTQQLIKNIRAGGKITAKDLDTVMGPCPIRPLSPREQRQTRAALDQRIEEFRSTRPTGDDYKVVINARDDL